MRIGSCFSGIDGLALGLEWAGVGHTVWQVERDPYCRAVLAKHWPHATRYDDVCTVGAHNLEPVDVICGGFPCQDISYAGKGAGLDGARSGLWFEFARIVGELGPRYVVVENVAALLTRGIDAVLATLADLGYDAERSTLRASDVGAPHRRERVFLVAYAQGAHGWSEQQPGRTGSGWAGPAGIGGSVGDAQRVWELQPQRSEPNERGRDRHTGNCVGDADDTGPQGHGRPVKLDGAARRDAARRHRAASGVHVGWSDATPVRGADGTVRLIPAQAAQEGPESSLWPVADGVPGRVARLRAIGNAVVPACAEVVGRRLLEIDATLTRERAA